MKTACRIFAIAVVLMLGMNIIPTRAFAWPTTAEWIPIYKGGTVVQDPTNDANGARNIVDSTGHAAGYVFYDGTYFFTRLRLDADPTGQGGQGLLQQYGWGEEFDTNQNADDYEWLTLVDGKGSPTINNGNETILLEQNTVQQNIGDPSDKCEVVNSWIDLVGNYQVNVADTSTNGDQDYFLDFRFPYATLKAALGIDDYQPIRILFGSSSSTNSLVESGADLAGGTNLTLYTGLSDYIVPLGGTRPTDGTVWFRNSTDTADVTQAAPGDTLYIKVQDIDRDINATTLQTVTVTLTVPGRDTVSGIVLTETGVNTGIFWGSVPTVSSDTFDNTNSTLELRSGETVTVTYTDAIAADLARDVPRTDTLGTPSPALSVAKTVTPASVVAGADVAYTITITNTGGGDGWVSSIVDTLPAGFTYVTGSTTGLTTANPSIGGQALTWSGSWKVSRNSSSTLTFHATASSTDGTYNNNVTVNSNNHATVQTGNTAPVTVIHLSIAKSVNPSSVVAGGTVAYTITLSSTGSLAVPVTQVVDTLPAGFTYVNGTTTGLTTNNPGIAGQALTWNGAWSIPANGSLTLTFNATASSTDGTYNNNATYTPTGYPVQSTGNTAPVTVIHLSIAKSVNPSSVVAGGTVAYTITLSSTGSLAVPVTQVVDTLPAGFTYVNGTTTGLTTNNPGIAGQALTWNGAWSIPANGTLTLTFNATASSTDGTYNNSATYTPTGYPVQSASNAAPVTVIHLGITKTVAPSTTYCGGTVAYTVTLSSTSGFAVPVTQVTDTLPAGFAYNAGTTTGLTTNNPGIAGQALTWNGAWSIPANGTLTLNFQATTSAVPGTHNNSASFTPTGYPVQSVGPTAPVVTYTATDGSVMYVADLAGNGDVTQINAGGTLYVKVTDLDRNTNSGMAQTVTVTLSAPDGDDETITLTETGVNTGIFTGSIPTALSLTQTDNNGTLQVLQAETVTVTYVDAVAANLSLNVPRTDTVSMLASSLSIAKTVTPSLTVASGPVAYTITITNSGGADGSLTSLVDTLPAGFSYINGTTTGFTTANPVVAGQVLTWSGTWTIPKKVGAVNGVLTLVFHANASASLGTFNNNVTINGSNFPSVSTGNTAPVVVASAPAITLTKSVDNASAAPGDVLTYTVHYHNTGGSPALNLIILDAIPAGTTYVPGSQKVGNASTTYATATTIPDNVSGGNVTFILSTVDADDGVPNSGNDEGKVYLQLIISH